MGSSFSASGQMATKVFRLSSSATGTNAQVIKNSPGTLFGIEGYNSFSELTFVKLYDLNRAPNPATDTPKLSRPMAGQSIFSQLVTPIQFTNGIAMLLTMGPADTDATGVSQDQVTGINVLYS